MHEPTSGFTKKKKERMFPEIKKKTKIPKIKKKTKIPRVTQDNGWNSQKQLSGLAEKIKLIHVQEMK